MSEILGEVAGKDMGAHSLFFDSGQEPARAGGTRPARFAAALSPHMFIGLAMAVDATVFTFMCAGAYTVRGFVSSLPSSAILQPYGVALFALWFFAAARLFRVENIGDFGRYFRGFCQVWCFLALAVLAVDAVGQLGAAHGFHRGWALHAAMLILWMAACGLALAGARYGLAGAFRYCVRKQLVVHDVVIVGATDLAAQFIHRAASDRYGVRVKAIFDDSLCDRGLSEFAGVPVQGGVDHLLTYSKRHDISEVVVALPFQDSGSLHSVMRRLSIQPLKISVPLPSLAVDAAPGWCAPAGGMPGIPAMPLINLPIDFRGRLLKTCFDRVGAALALLFFAPLMIACAVGIMLTSPGPIFFRQRRIGYRNREFEVFKFRSMHVDACNTGRLTSRNDPRVFAFGQLMRKLSLDELPQLFNVLLGDMSLVGPRPHMPEARAAGEFYFDVVQEYAARHRVKPGITGWAQINGWRGPTETVVQIEQRVAHDLHYISHWSFWLDLKILAKTALVGFFGDNAF